MLNDLINALMARSDWESATKTPVGIVPIPETGKGGGMAKSLSTPCPVSAMLNIIKGAVRPLDLLSIRVEGEPVLWSHTQMSWGLIADIDVGSSGLPSWAGSSRFALSGIATLVNMAEYGGTITYLPWYDDINKEVRSQ